MIDRAAREEAATLIREFRDGRLSNDALEDAWPRSEDPVLSAIAHALWFHYDDLREHRLENPSEALVIGLNRCIDFLNSSLPYEWPRRPYLKRLMDALSRRRTPPGGDPEAWPFFRSSDQQRPD